MFESITIGQYRYGCRYRYRYIYRNSFLASGNTSYDIFLKFYNVTFFFQAIA